MERSRRSDAKLRSLAADGGVAWLVTARPRSGGPSQVGPEDGVGLPAAGGSGAKAGQDLDAIGVVERWGALPGGGDAADPVWELGSITKVVTGILLARLALDGTVALEDPIGRHLPADVAARLPSPADQPRLADLASHTAGLPRLSRPILRAMRHGDASDPYAALTVEEVYASLGSRTRRPRRPKPRYSNLGVGLLGHLLERATGRPYPELAHELVLVPLGVAGMDVGADPPAVVPGRRGRKPATAWTFGALGAAGALRGRIGELVRLGRAVLEPPSSLASAIDLSLQPRVAAGRDLAVGLAWHLRRVAGRTVAWHNGGTYGAASFLGLEGHSGVVVAGVANRGPRPTSPLDDAAWERVRGAIVSPP